MGKTLTFSGKPDPMSPCRILIAEDDDDDYFTLEEAFASTDFYSIRIRSSNGEQLLMQLHALEAECQLPNLIILDINMPRMDGIETLKKIKLNKNLSFIPVFIYSTSNSVEQMRNCYELGADLFVTKGNDFQTVLNFTDHAIKFCQHHQADALLRAEVPRS